MLSRYTPIGDRYCHPCHPQVETVKAAATCRRGHDRSVHGVIRKGRWDCRACDAARKRKTKGPHDGQ